MIPDLTPTQWLIAAAFWCAHCTFTACAYFALCLGWQHLQRWCLRRRLLAMQREQEQQKVIAAARASRKQARWLTRNAR